MTVENLINTLFPKSEYTFDAEVDAGYVKLGKGHAARTIYLSDDAPYMVMLDLDKDGNPVGMKIVNFC